MGIFDRFFGPPSKDKFAKMFLARIRQAGETRKLAYDPEQHCVMVAENQGRRMYVDNIYAEYSSTPPDGQTAVMQRFVRSWFDSEKSIPDDFAAASHDLLPVVRSQAYFSAAALLMQLEDKQFADVPQQPIAEDLAISLVYDFRDAMRVIGSKDLERWNVTLYEALEVARENLQKLPFQFMGPKDGEGVYLSATHDNYDASRLLLLDVIRQFRVKGDYVAMVPNRDTLIVTGSDDNQGVQGMAALGERGFAEAAADVGIGTSTRRR